MIKDLSSFLVIKPDRDERNQSYSVYCGYMRGFMPTIKFDTINQ